MAGKIYIVFIMILFGTACKVREISKIPESEKEPSTRIAGAIRGTFIPASSWVEDGHPPGMDQIPAIMSNLANNNHNTVLYQLNDRVGTLYFATDDRKAEIQLDPISHAIKEAHFRGLEFYASFDMNGLFDGISSTDNKAQPSVSEIKSHIKEPLIHLVRNYNIDGIHLLIDDLPGFLDKLPDKIEYHGFSDEKYQWQFFTDLVEDIMAETMLLKPYLINSVSFKFPENAGAQGYRQIIHGIHNWLKKGVIDLFIPVFSPADPQLSLNIEPGQSDEKSLVTSRRVIPGVQLNITTSDSVMIYDLLRDHGKVTGNRSLIVFPEKSVLKFNDWQIPVNYSEKIDLPDSLKAINPRQVVGLNLSEIRSEYNQPVTVTLTDTEMTKWPDINGRIGIIVSELPDTLELVFDDITIPLPTQFWQIPYNYHVTGKNQAERKMPWLELRKMPDIITDEPEHHLLYRTAYPAKAWINGDTVKVYKTGIFFKKVVLKDGINRIKAKVMAEDSSTAVYEREFFYRQTEKSRKTLPLWIDENSITPAEQLIMTPEDIIHFSFRGSYGQKGIIKIYPSEIILECSRKDFEDYSIYEAELPLEKLDLLKDYTFKAVLETSHVSNESLGLLSPASLIVKNTWDFPYVKTVNPHTRMTYTLGEVRLGGPLRAEYPPGIILKTNARIGDHYRIRLNEIDHGFVYEKNVGELPSDFSQKSYYITSMSCGPTDTADVVTIPYPESLPYAVYPEPDLKRIRILIYGAKTSSTWITHRKGRKIIDKITWQQTTPETYEVYVNLRTDKIWGYDLQKFRNSLLLIIKHAPSVDTLKEKPLSGLKVAIEAGHGGESYGAMGLSGLLEKDINLDLSLKLGKLLTSYGAEVLQVRETDTTMSLLDKRDKAKNSGADMLISIHANAAGTRQGYLGVSGTSTYYHNPFWAALAGYVYERLLEMDLPEFGVIGSFNYTVTRVSLMPSILVEQAFMTHAEDEEMLATEEFRQEMAEKIYKGILDYLNYMKN